MTTWVTTWYEAQSYNNRIRPVEVTRATKEAVWVLDTDWTGKKNLLCLNRMTVYETPEEAVEALRSGIHDELSRTKARVEKLEKDLKEFEAAVADGSVHVQSVKKGGES